jgi:hypothetical protein
MSVVQLGLKFQKILQDKMIGENFFSSSFINKRDEDRWGYQDFAAGEIIGTSVTLTRNDNGIGAYFHSGKIIGGVFRAITSRSDNPLKYVYSGSIALFSTKIKVNSIVGAAVVLNAIPYATTPVRIWYRISTNKIGLFHEDPPPQISSEALTALDDDLNILVGDDVIDNLTSTDINKPLSANMGKSLFLNINTGSSVAPITIANLPSGGAIGTAAATVDINNVFLINQTTAGQTITLPNPTNETLSQTITLSANSTASFIAYGNIIAAGSSASFLWNGSAWNSIGINPITKYAYWGMNSGDPTIAGNAVPTMTYLKSPNNTSSSIRLNDSPNNDHAILTATDNSSVGILSFGQLSVDKNSWRLKANVWQNGDADSLNFYFFASALPPYTNGAGSQTTALNQYEVQLNIYNNVIVIRYNGTVLKSFTNVNLNLGSLFVAFEIEFHNGNFRIYIGNQRGLVGDFTDSSFSSRALNSNTFFGVRAYSGGLTAYQGVQAINFTSY